MAGELLMLDHQETFFAFSTDFEKVCQLQLQPGTSYLVLARGDVSVEAGQIDLRLETADAADDASFTQGHGGPTHFEKGHSSFALMLATRVPSDPGPTRISSPLPCSPRVGARTAEAASSTASSSLRWPSTTSRSRAASAWRAR
jgi:hypothetical protein